MSSILFYIDGEIGFPSTPIRFTDTYIKVVKDNLDRFYKDEFVYPLCLSQACADTMADDSIKRAINNLIAKYLIELRISYSGEMYIIRSIQKPGEEDAMVTTEFLPTGEGVRYVIGIDGSERDAAAALLANFTTKKKFEKDIDKFLIGNNSKYTWVKVKDICAKLLMKSSENRAVLENLIKTMNENNPC